MYRSAFSFLFFTAEKDKIFCFKEIAIFHQNFFDTILQQKEYFSSYVFEDLAKEFLDKNPKIKAELEQKKQNDKAFAENGAAQLDWVYRQSPYYEKAHLQYPVYRVN